MRRALGLLVLAMLAFGVMAAVPAAAEPSSYCNGGMAPPYTTPAGIGAVAVGDPTGGGMVVIVCNSGATVPAPGAVGIATTPLSQRADVAYDGDSSNTLTPCTDGWFGIHADAGPNVVLASSPDGEYHSANPGMAPDVFVMSLLLCAPAAPSVPAPGLPV